MHLGVEKLKKNVYFIEQWVFKIRNKILVCFAYPSKFEENR